MPQAGGVGILTYNSTRSIELDDRTLAHLRSVVYAKLRRGESFAFSWENTAERGSGRHSIWMSPGTPLAFQFFDTQEIALNPEWIRQLTKSANSPGGLVPSAEPTD
jgi:hypothetical protein